MQRTEPGQAGATAPEASSNGEHLQGGRLLAVDLRVAGGLLNEARYGAVKRVFGVPRDQATLLTLVGLMVLARTAHDKFIQYMTGPGPPTQADGILGIAVLREVARGVAGPVLKDTSPNALIAVAALAALSRPGLAKSVQGLRAGSQRARIGFNRRYGHRVPGGRRGRD